MAAIPNLKDSICTVGMCCSPDTKKGLPSSECAGPGHRNIMLCRNHNQWHLGSTHLYLLLTYSQTYCLVLLITALEMPEKDTSGIWLYIDKFLSGESQPPFHLLQNNPGLVMTSTVPSLHGTLPGKYGLRGMLSEGSREVCPVQFIITSTAWWWRSITDDRRMQSPSCQIFSRRPSSHTDSDL